MGTKKNNYSKEFKIMVVKDYLCGSSGGIVKISKKYNIPYDIIVSRWIRKYREFGEIGLDDNRGKYKGLNKGRPRKSEISTEERILKLEAENAYLRKILEKRESLLKKNK